MLKKNRALPVTATTGIAAIALSVSLLGIGSESALADGGFDLTVTNPTPAATLPIPSATPQKSSGLQSHPRSMRKRQIHGEGWDSNRDTNSSNGASGS